MKREFNVEANIGKPQVSYREKITKSGVEIEGKFVRQSGGRGQFGHCWIRFSEPEQDDKGNITEGLVFSNEVVGGVIPKEYIPAIQKGIEEQMKNGVVAGYPLIGLKAAVFDGSYHDVDSNEMAFKIAASMATKQLAQKGGGVVLEPIMKVEVVTPEDYLGDVMGDLNRRRGLVGVWMSRSLAVSSALKFRSERCSVTQPTFVPCLRVAQATPWNSPNTPKLRRTSSKHSLKNKANPL